MQYRRFGRTELEMPVFSCGGMRYQHAWKDAEPHDIPGDAQENLERTIDRALQSGINHIETARGYGTSEMQLGWILPRLPREQMIVQTKVAPHSEPKEFLANFEKSYKYLGLEYVDLLAFHGVNTPELLRDVLRRGGCLEVARGLQKEGRVRFIGFSTHGAEKLITEAARTGEFDYMNVHWYFVNDFNWPSIEEATRQDMGVFIISPNDKGGKLYEPSPKIVELCAPLTPMQFNDLYCLKRPEVHTLSIGASRPTDFDEHVEALTYYDTIPETISAIEERLREEMEKVLGEAWCRDWWKDLPESTEIPGEVNVREILRLWTYSKSLGLVTWGRMRYNLLGNANHFFPGKNAGDFDEEQMMAAVAQNPLAARIPQVLREAHDLLLDAPQKRLSES